MQRVKGPNFTVISCAENRRTALFQAALERNGLGKAKLIPWLDFIRNRASLEPFHKPVTILRIDSAGENFAVEREFIALGADLNHGTKASFIGANHARLLEFDCGRILYPRQYFLGFQACLRRLEQQLELSEIALVMNHPREIALMFDKRKCHAWLRQNSVSVPDSLEDVKSYEHLREMMKEKHWHRVFVKLAYSSSASGVVAYETNWQREQGWTSVEIVGAGKETRLYNSLRVRRYTDAKEIAAIIDAICAEGVHVEQWIPKLGFDGYATDLRVVVIEGQASHTVLRMSKSPLTNLHLGNQRGDLQAFIERHGEDAWRKVEDECRKTARLFPGSLYAGIDVGLTATLSRAFVFEVNAFGDLLPNVLYNGVDTYEFEIKAAWNRFTLTCNE